MKTSNFGLLSESSVGSRVWFQKSDMLTLFAIPKHFHQKIETIQRNAITSWTFLKPRPEIILFGEEKGIEQLSAELGLIHVPQIARNEYNTPLIDDLFHKARRISRNNLLCYVNADLILLDDFMEAVGRIPLKRFMMTGQRLDLDLNEPMDFRSHDWQDRLLGVAAQRGKWHGHTGLDYFIFPRDLFQKLPPFAVGRTMWDNWLVYKARSLNVPVVDSTQMVTVIHQNHGYSQCEEWIKKGPEAQKNLALGGGWSHVFTLEDASHLLTPKGLKKPKVTRKRLIRQLDTLIVIRPYLGFWAKLTKGILAPGIFWNTIKRKIKRL